MGGRVDSNSSETEVVCSHIRLQDGWNMCYVRQGQMELEECGCFILAFLPTSGTFINRGNTFFETRSVYPISVLIINVMKSIKSMKIYEIYEIYENL